MSSRPGPSEILSSLRLPARAVNRVLANLTPDHGRVTGKTLMHHRVGVSLAALAIIEAAQAMRAAEGDSGGPALSMTLLDPLVQDAARRHWELGHYRIAVGDAATNVDRYTQRLLERSDVSGSTLMEAAFRFNTPAPGKRRLRCPGHPGERSCSIAAGPEPSTTRKPVSWRCETRPKQVPVSYV